MVKFTCARDPGVLRHGVLEEDGNPPEGKVMAVFSVAATGLTDKVKIDRKKTTIKNQRIQDCVTDAIRSWEFPKPTDGREHPIEYPFELKVAKEK